MENQNNERLILKTKAFITDLLAGVNTEDSIQDIIGYIMRQTGIFTHAESVCIYEAGTGMENVEKVYQWEAENTDAKDVSDKPVPKKDIADWFSVLKQKKLVIVPSAPSTVTVATTCSAVQLSRCSVADTVGANMAGFHSPRRVDSST